MNVEAQVVDRIAPVPPSPSLLTSARDRTSDGFGAAGVGATLDLLPLIGDDAERERVRSQLTSWRTGVSWTPISCSSTHNWPRCPVDVDDEHPTKDEADAPLGAVAVDSFTIYTPLACDWVTRSRGDAMAQDAVALNQARAAGAIAGALWMGEGLPDDPDQPTLRRTATDVSIGGGAADLDDVVSALLSAYDACTDGLGGAVVHVPAVLITGALGGIPGGGKVATPEGNIYRGPLGSIISPGPGYPHGASDDGPDGYGPLIDPAEDGEYSGNELDEVWVYVTGPVEYALGDQIVLGVDEVERRLGPQRANRYEVWAERQAIVRFDPCCVFAALATNTAGPVS